MIFIFFSEPKINYSISYKPASYWYFTVTPMATQTTFTSGMWAASPQALPAECSGFPFQRVSNVCEPSTFGQVIR